MTNQINIQMLKNYFHYVINNEIILKIDEEFFKQQVDIYKTYLTIKEHYIQTNKLELNLSNLLSINPNLNRKITATLLTDLSYKQLDKNFIKKQFLKDYEIYVKGQYVNNIIDDYRNGNYDKIKLDYKIDINDNLLGERFSTNKSYDDIEYLFYPLFRERQLGCIFGKTGQGKSIITLDIANQIASGKTYWEGEFKVDKKPQNVLYIDFELGGEILMKRYKNKDISKNLYIHCVDNFEYNKYIGINNKINVKLENSLNYIEKLSEKYNSKVIFIDNLSNIADQVEQATDAEMFVNELYGRVKHKKITIILIAHTPKIPNNVIIELNHLKGSSTLSKTFGSVIAFNKTKEKNISYIKQVKYRSEECIYDEENVGMFEFNKNDFSLKYIGVDDENNLIEQKKIGRPTKYDDVIKYDVLYDIEENNLSYRKIQDKYSISRGTIMNIKKNYQQNPNFKGEYNSWLQNKIDGNELF